MGVSPRGSAPSLSLWVMTWNGAFGRRSASASCRLQVGDPGANCKAAALGRGRDRQVVLGWRHPHGRLPSRYRAKFSLWVMAWNGAFGRRSASASCRLQVGGPGANCKAATLGTGWDRQVVLGWRRPYGRLPIRYCAKFSLWVMTTWGRGFGRRSASASMPTASRRSQPCLAMAALWQLSIDN